MPHVTLHTDGPASVVTLDRPERLNAIGQQLLADLQAALVRAQADAATSVIVFTGAGRAFCAGDDLKDHARQAATPASVAAMADGIQQITRELMLGPKLVIGAAAGYAVGGGFEWLLNCDLVVAADDLVACFPEMGLGHFVTGGVTRWLPRALGHQRAMELLVLGERQDAAALLRLGLVNRVVPRAALMAEAMALAVQVAQRSPRALAHLKRALVGLPAGALEEALRHERDAAVDCFADPLTVGRVKVALQRGAG